MKDIDALIQAYHKRNRNEKMQRLMQRHGKIVSCGELIAEGFLKENREYGRSANNSAGIKLYIAVGAIEKWPVYDKKEDFVWPNGENMKIVSEIASHWEPSRVKLKIKASYDLITMTRECMDASCDWAYIPWEDISASHNHVGVNLSYVLEVLSGKRKGQKLESKITVPNVQDFGCCFYHVIRNARI